MALVDHLWLAGQLHQLTFQPFGTYGISYDIYTRPTEDPVPGGWESPRVKTYRELIKRLRAAGFGHHQYSDHCHTEVAALEAYQVMIDLTHIRPNNKLSTTVKGLKLHYIHDMNLMDVSNEVKLGGHLAQRLVGPAPRNLVHRLVGNGHNLSAPLQPVPQGHPGVPPLYTTPSPAAMNVANYVM
ncbi:hypothetical protein BD309DRAFT_1078627 [Dichomitus squalens]|uniref:Uncharacterized protein n=1 Tax=Dichomitus squalens TaxID=114155 RepID=A0A4Q9QEP6_9APHY|nr:uncharacterized protein DICSQDRAFT_152267 [Dichomitus squalens LYAD-421 SS1]EJF66302.1 hypothetical protein DICSQDRAFT_152267 [Dichomitus squalens LYAD-421 SS1]TBU35444.1 hypothetical protein BD311DRAFT_792830 [Dichomitus squalens]TBU46429.1 hypothetical protein BD309DRAFT_1078627 [Dichomitus squalens]TBU65284.1 hypothetical protein BD310DRAFT_911070 [Dichomitus squalens]